MKKLFRSSLMMSIPLRRGLICAMYVRTNRTYRYTGLLQMDKHNNHKISTYKDSAIVMGLEGRQGTELALFHVSPGREGLDSSISAILERRAVVALG
jgi:hypothetical protein